MTNYNAKEFILEFFEGSKVKEEKGILTISEVQKDFEEFIGKKAPYKLVFDLETYVKTKDSELVTQGSYLLLAIKDYLSNKGQTSLLKINIKPDLLKISKNSKLKNYKIIKIDEKEYNTLSEFYFLSIYQYLNDKKQAINRFLIQNNKLSNLDLDKFKISKGDKEKISNSEFNKEYNLAKKKLNLQVIKQINAIKIPLNKKLEKELKRIKDYYHRQIKEKDEEIEKCEQKIKLLENKVKHTFYDRDIDTLNRMIRESKVRLEMLQRKNYKQRLKTEESFHINDEVEKHVLSIKNTLINTTIYYYPIYSIEATYKGKKVIKKYDPVLEKVI